MKLFDNLPVVTFVVYQHGCVLRRFRSTQQELSKHFPMKYGLPVFGKCVFRELTLAEIKKRTGLPSIAESRRYKARNYIDCIVNP